MEKYIVTAESINGTVFLLRNGRTWTGERLDAFRYNKKSIRRAVRRSIQRFSVILRGIHAEIDRQAV